MGITTRTRQESANRRIGESVKQQFLRFSASPFLHFIVLFSFLAIPSRVIAADPPIAPSDLSPATPTKLAPSDPAASPISGDTVLEEGKALYDNGQYLAALDKFFTVLRRNPRDQEARQYVSLVVDQIRNKRKVTPGQSADAQPTVPAPVLDEEVRARVHQRQLLTMDLAAIPGVHISQDGKQSQVEIDTSLLFADKTGGLKEQSVPVLDRVSAWLKTFGQQPIVIHCYPEELQDSSMNGSLFLHRYAQLYGFFVDERKMPANRFVNAELMNTQNTASTPDVSLASGTPRVVIASIGGGATEIAPNLQVSRWLEFSILSSRMFFNPQDGDWASLDLSALTRKGVKVWYFKIAPAGKNKSAVVSMEGKGNLLKRVSWDGRDEKSGSFVAPGNYIVKLSATDVDGASMNQQITLKIQSSTGEEPTALDQKPKKSTAPKVAHKPKPKAPVATAAPAEETAVSTGTELDQAVDVASLPQASEPDKTTPPTATVPAAETPAPEPAAAEPDTSSDDAAGSVHAIWKQVIQFDTNDSDLKPTLKASLERIGKTLEVYPLQKVRIMGFAEASESNASSLARRRAEMVRDTLINEYQVDAKRVIVAGGKVASGASHGSKVEMSITN